MALEWILAKVGRRLAETPAEDGLGSFLTLEDRPLPPPPAATAAAAADSDRQGNDQGGGGGGGGGGADDGVGAWGGEELWVVPAAVCDVALRENVGTELEARRAGGGGVALALEDLRAEPTEAFSWEPRPAGLGRARAEESPAVEAAAATTAGGGPGVGEHGERSTAAGGLGQGQGSGCDRGMVFGDAGAWGSEQTAMFQVREGGGSADARGGRKQADIVQVGYTAG